MLAAEDRECWTRRLYQCIPPVILILSYVWLAIAHRRVVLRDVPVHESGRYTLLDTIFYFNHFLREIPIDVAMGLFLLAAFTEYSGFRMQALVDDGRPRRLAYWSLAGALALTGIGFAAATWRDGAASAVHDLLQFRTRDDLSWYGSHWRFHFLSSLWIGLAAPLLVRGLYAGWGPRQVHLGNTERAVIAIAWGYFCLLTIVFGLSTQVLWDPRYIGHQAREILTHGPVTCLLAIGTLDAAARWMSVPPREPPAPSHTLQRARVAEWLRLLLVLLIPGYLAIASPWGAVMGAGQPEGGLAAMLAAHVFEHILDYLLVGLLVVGGYGWLLSRAS